MAFDLAKFIFDNNGKFIDYDGAYGNQCVDAIRRYAHDLFKINAYTTIPTTGSAKNIFNNFKDNKYFKKVLNTPTGVPPKGAIVFFKTSVWFPFIFGVDGHTGIIWESNVKDMVVFNQNYPTNSPCKLTKFTYKDCLGWLVPQ